MLHGPSWVGEAWFLGALALLCFRLAPGAPTGSLERVPCSAPGPELFTCPGWPSGCSEDLARALSSCITSAHQNSSPLCSPHSLFPSSIPPCTSSCARNVRKTWQNIHQAISSGYFEGSYVGGNYTGFLCSCYICSFYEENYVYTLPSHFLCSASSDVSSSVNSASPHPYETTYVLPFLSLFHFLLDSFSFYQITHLSPCLSFLSYHAAKVFQFPDFSVWDQVSLLLSHLSLFLCSHVEFRNRELLRAPPCHALSAVKPHFLSPPRSIPSSPGHQKASSEQGGPRTAVDPENSFNLSLSH